jgi:hypothetical protein
MKLVRSVAVVLFLICGVAVGQENRATLTGRVTDPAGAVVPKARIAVIQTDTGAQTNVLSNSAGDYTVPFLEPGPYSVSVTAAGFEKFVHTGITLQVEQTVTENIKLSIGETTQTVTVHAESPLVDIATATTGQTLTAEEVEDLPSNGRSPLGFAHLEYGAVAKGKHSASQVRPFDNSVGDDFSLGGGNSASNEILMNGVPNMEDGSRTAGYSPQLDAVDAVRVDEFSANAALGDTAGGFLNITTKGGTNQYHGSASEYYSGSRPLTAEPFFTPIGTKVSSVHFNQFGGTIGGPVRIPHLFNGRDKLFFFYAFEGYIGKSPSTVIESVPTAQERAGDFAALLGVSTSNQLYNPYGATMNSKGVSRSQIPGNCIVTSSYCTSTATDASGAPLTINPVAQAYLNLMPMPNYNGATTGADGENNYFASDPTINNYKSNQADIDWNITTANKVRFEAHRSNYASSSGQTFFNSLTGTTQDTVLWGGQVDDVHTFSPTLGLETRLGFSRYDTSSEPTSQGISPNTVGMPSYVAANSTLLALPSMTFKDASNIQALSGAPGSTEEFDTIQFYTSLNKVWGHHTIKVGADIRANKWSTLSPGAANGNYAFNAGANSFVSSGPGGATSGANQLFGSSFALFELGLPASSSTFNVATKFQYDNWYNAFFAQDDWKATHNLTISLGVRLDHETPDVESNNNLVSGFNPSAPNAGTAAAIAAYATAPISQLSAANYQPTGNVIYATPSNRSAYSPAPLYVSPRIGFAYSPEFSHGTLAIRGGFAIYVNPFGDYTSNWGPSYGFTQSTSFVPSNNSNLTPATTLSDPFPVATSALGGAANPIVQPYGSTYGINTQLGSSITFYAPVKVPYSEKFQFDVQKQIAGSWLVEASYVGDHQVHNNYNNALSSAPLLPFLSRSPQLDPVVNSELSLSVANPSYKTMSATTTGPAATTGLNTSKTTTVGALLQTYPEYTSVTEGLVPGESGNFNAFLFKVSHRMSHGLQFDFNYIHSRNLGTPSQLNPGGALWYGETSSDFPDHASLTAIYLLPFGKGRRFANNSKLLDELIGGYSLTTIYQYLSGTPQSWGNVDYTGNWNDFNLNAHNYKGATFNTSGFYTGSAQPNGNNFRTFPAMFLRSDPTKNFDFSLLKNFTIWERLVIQPRVDAFNAFNRPQFGNQNVSPTSSAFSEVSSQLNSSRQLQGGVHILF